MAKCAHLLIDGYNVLHAWNEGRKALRKGQEHAIRMLSTFVRVIHDVEGVATSIVFDGNGPEVQVVREDGITTFCHIFSPAGASADAIIEQMVNNAPMPADMVVVSRDNLVRESIIASGGSPMYPEDLFSWVKSCEKLQRARMGERRRDLEREWNEANRIQF